MVKTMSKKLVVTVRYGWHRKKIKVDADELVNGDGWEAQTLESNFWYRVNQVLGMENDY